MKKLFSFLFAALVAVQFASCSASNPNSISGRRFESEARAALNRLYQSTPAAKKLGSSAAAVLIFPEITKAGLMVGGQYGDGVLFKGGESAGHYNSSAASYGLQAGVQTFGYAMFFSSPADLAYLNESDGWEVGVGPSITVVDEGLAGSLTTTTARKGVYVFFFEQKGLMAGLGIQGTKITRIG